MQRLLCWLGLHDRDATAKWTPSFSSKIVTEFEYRCWCRVCGKTISHTHWRWDAETQEMVDV